MFVIREKCLEIFLKTHFTIIGLIFKIFRKNQFWVWICDFVTLQGGENGPFFSVMIWTARFESPQSKNCQFRSLNEVSQTLSWCSRIRSELWRVKICFQHDYMKTLCCPAFFWFWSRETGFGALICDEISEVWTVLVKKSRGWVSCSETSEIIIKLKHR